MVARHNHIIVLKSSVYFAKTVIHSDYTFHTIYVLPFDVNKVLFLKSFHFILLVPIIEFESQNNMLKITQPCDAIQVPPGQRLHGQRNVFKYAGCVAYEQKHCGEGMRSFLWEFPRAASKQLCSYP